MPLERLAAAIEANATATREALAGINNTLAATSGRLTEIEQALARIRQSGGGSSAGAMSSLAADVSKDEGFQAYIARRAEKAIVPVKASALLGMGRRLEVFNTITSTITDGTIAPAARRPDIAFGPTKSQWLWELMGPPMPVTGAGSVEYVRETTAPTNAAAQSAEGAAKNESTVTFALINDPIPTIAHWLKASRQALSDSAALQRYLDVRLPWGLNLRLEDDIVNGTGAGGAQKGLLHADNHTAYGGGAGGDTAVDTIRRAIGQLAESNFIADAVLLHPTTWTAMDLLKSGDDEHYVLGDPKAAPSNTVWSRLVYETTALSPGEFIVGAFAQSCEWHPREDAVIRVSDSDSDNFTKNLVTVLAELRGLATVNLPAGIIAGDLGALS
jgi:HK97 family phage major capsid protein